MSVIVSNFAKALNLEHRMAMTAERHINLYYQLITGGFWQAYLQLRVSRKNIVRDTLIGLELVAMERPEDLKKQLFIEFDGEQGVDEGGVQKEFFQLVIEQLFNVDFGMFVYDQSTRLFWFNGTSFESEAEFLLVGMILGLAIYNHVILDLKFPLVVYKKLLGKLGSWEDLSEAWPTMYSSLKQLVDYEGTDVAETFSLDFCCSFTDPMGDVYTHALRPEGHTIAVTHENKMEFVRLYSDFLLNQSVARQFRAFKAGFEMVMTGSWLHESHCSAQELMLFICGSRDSDYNFEALEEGTEYDGGYSSDHPTIRHLWSVLGEYTIQQRQLFLKFCTGSDRVPLGGLSKLRFAVVRNGPDTDRLPTAHTCFNILLLPDYGSREKLCQLLTKALAFSEGFGML